MKTALLIFTAVVFLAGCKHSSTSTREAVPTEIIARLEQSIQTLTPGMTKEQALAHIQFAELEKYISRGSGGGPNTRYHLDYFLGDAGILSLIHNKDGLNQIEFWNRTTRKKTTSKPLHPT